jgi:hypothetical protein
MRKQTLLFVVAGLTAAGVLAVSAAATLSGSTATIAVKEASFVGGCVAGQQQVDIVADVTVTNNTGGPITLASAAYHAHADGNAAPIAATVNLNGGLPGATIANGSLTVFNVGLTTLIPCATTNAEVCVVVSVLNPTATLDEACAGFISGGSPIPGGMIGILGTAVLLGAGLLLAQRVLVGRKQCASTVERR